MFLAFIAKEWKWVAGLLILVVALFGFYEELKLHRPLPMAVIKGVTKLEVFDEAKSGCNSSTGSCRKDDPGRKGSSAGSLYYR